MWRHLLIVPGCSRATPTGRGARCIFWQVGRHSKHVPTLYFRHGGLLGEYDMPSHLKISDLATRAAVWRNRLGEERSCTTPTARSKEDGGTALSSPQSPNLPSQGTRHLHCSTNKEGTHLLAGERNGGQQITVRIEAWGRTQYGTVDGRPGVRRLRGRAHRQASDGGAAPQARPRRRSSSPNRQPKWVILGESPCGRKRPRGYAYSSDGLDGSRSMVAALLSMLVTFYLSFPGKLFPLISHPPTRISSTAWEGTGNPKGHVAVAF